MSLLPKELFSKNSKIVFLTGAGISIQSGIPDFKTLDETWPYVIPRAEMSSLPFFLQEPELFWEAQWHTIASKKNAKPNVFHEAVALLEENVSSVEIFTQFEILNQNFSDNWAATYRPLARSIDEKQRGFLKDSKGLDVYASLSIASKMNKDTQEFIDGEIRDWYDDCNREISTIMGKNDEDRKTRNEKWRTATSELRDSYTVDILEPKLTRNKNLVKFIQRSGENYEALTKAIMAVDHTTERRYSYRKIDDHGLYSYKLDADHYTYEELKSIAKISPEGARAIYRSGHKMRVNNIEAKEIYETLTESPDHYGQDWQDARRDAIADVLKNSSLIDNTEVFLDASTKLNKEHGLAAKDFAKIMKSKIREFEKDGRALRADQKEMIRSTVDNVRTVKN